MIKQVYLDNAATTPMAPEVLEVMLPVLRNQFGNPSSTHSFGRKTRALIEVSRRNIARMLNSAPGEIFFTSGGTEADNMAIKGAIESIGIKHAITSTIEHHAVGHTLENYEKVLSGFVELFSLHLWDTCLYVCFCSGGPFGRIRLTCMAVNI